MKIQDFFQKGYYINLDKRKDRDIQFQKTVQSLNLSGFFERISAFEYNEKEYYDIYSACNRSHIYVIKHAYSLGFERILVFEDDILLMENAIDNIEKSLESLSKIDDWDLIYFGSMILDPELNLVSPHLLKQYRLLTAHAIGYSRSAMKKIIEHPNIKRESHYKIPAGSFDDWIGENYELNKYVTYPLAITQTSDESDINKYGTGAPLEDYTKGYLKPLKKYEKN